jgi:hypothetical protein
MALVLELAHNLVGIVALSQVGLEPNFVPH